MKKGILAALALGFLGGQAFGDTQTVTYTNIVPTIFDPGVFPAANGSPLNFTNNISLPQWDASLFPNRILTGVTVTMTAYMYGTYTINELSETATVSYTWSAATARVYQPFATSTEIATLRRSVATGTFNDLVTVLNDNPAVDPGSPQSGITGLSTSAPGPNVTPTGALNLYSGNGFILFPVNQSGTIAFSAEAVSGEPEITFSTTTAKFGAMTLSITYTHVPEAGTAAAATAISLAAGSIAWRRRKQKRTLES